MIPVLHTVCGKQVAWHNEDVAGRRRMASGYVRMDGSSPEPLSKVEEFCPHCNARIVDPMKTMKLDFFGGRK